jgi:hypothetical protein
MKKLILLYGLIICFSCNSWANRKEVNWDLSFNAKSSKPYACELFYNMLAYWYSSANLNTSKKILTRKNFLNNTQDSSTHDLKFFIANSIIFTEEEKLAIKKFVHDGNTVFITANEINNLMADFETTTIYESYYMDDLKWSNYLTKDSINYVKSEMLPMAQTISVFDTKRNDTISAQFKGRNISNYFVFKEESVEDNIIAYAEFEDLGMCKYNNEYNFFIARHGKGKIYFHTAPIAFTNYFLLQNNNKDYVECILRMLPSRFDKITYYSYINRVLENDSKMPETNPLSELLKFPMWRWAIGIAGIALLLYVMFNGKRRVRSLTTIPPIINNNLEFVETIGRLYFNNMDHQNLMEKMIQHFLEIIRSKYGLPTNQLDDKFAEQLYFKSGISTIEINQLLQQIKTMETTHTISDLQIIDFYNYLQSFIKKI